MHQGGLTTPVCARACHWSLIRRPECASVARKGYTVVFFTLVGSPVGLYALPRRRRVYISGFPVPPRATTIALLFSSNGRCPRMPHYDNTAPRRERYEKEIQNYKSRRWVADKSDLHALGVALIEPAIFSRETC